MKVIFFGTPDFAVPGLMSLINNPSCKVVAVVTQPDKPAGRGAKITESPIKKVALENNIPVFQPISVKKELTQFLQELSKLEQPDVGVVIAFGQILPIEALHFPKAGSINVHASILPRWRGAAPIQRSLLAGDAETGVCLMQMEAGLDTGPVFSMAKTPITASDTHGSLHDKLAALGAELLSRDLAQIVAGNIKSTPQAEVGLTYAKKIESIEGKIDWNKPALDVERQIRAFSPVPGAFTSLEGKRLKIFSAKITETLNTDISAEPGEIVAVNKDHFEIRTQDQLMRPLEVQLEGKKRMAIPEFLNGVKLEVGTKLGT